MAGVLCFLFMRNFIMVLFLFFFISCSHNVENSINVDFVSNNRVPNITIDSITFLETSSICLLGSITTLYVDSNRIYLLDVDHAKSLFLFSTKGEFLSKTSYGQGPNELLEPVDFYVDDSLVYIWDQSSSKMNYYDRALNFIEANKRDIVLRNFSRLGNDKWLVRSEYYDVYGKTTESDKTFYYYYIYSNDFERIEQTLIPFEQKFMSIALSDPIYKGRRPLFCNQFDMNIYGLDDEQRAIPIYKVNFIGKSLSEADKEKSLELIFKRQAEGDIVANIENIVCNNDLLSFQYPYKRDLHYVIYSKNDEVVYLSQSIISAGLLPKGRIHSVNSNNGFILTVSPIDFVEYVENHNNLGISKKVEIDDNPILVWFSVNQD